MDEHSPFTEEGKSLRSAPEGLSMSKPTLTNAFV